MNNLSILKITLRIFGVAFILIMPVMKLDPLGGWAWSPGQWEYEMMIQGVYMTLGVMMQIAQVLSGFTAGEADILRRAMGKKKRAELEKQKARFIDGAYQNGIQKDIAAGIFLKIEPFAEYGFNKSHAAAYAVIAYQTAYLKTYYPHEFFVASMSMELSNQKKLSEF